MPSNTAVPGPPWNAVEMPASPQGDRGRQVLLPEDEEHRLGIERPVVVEEEDIAPTVAVDVPRPEHDLGEGPGALLGERHAPEAQGADADLLGRIGRELRRDGGHEDHGGESAFMAKASHPGLRFHGVCPHRSLSGVMSNPGSG